MATDGKTGSSLPIGNLAAVALLVVGVAVQQLTPLQSSRPPATETNYGNPGAIQDVDARLWQDPFAAVTQYRDRQASQKRNPDANHDLPDLHKLINEDIAGHRKILVVGVMVFGDPYSEDAERRRRDRYAVLNGLNASGYIPEEDARIGFLKLDRQRDDFLPEFVPFEWFKPKDEGDDRRLLLVWLEESAFMGPEPLHNLGEFFYQIVPQQHRDALANKKNPPVTFKLIGPASSTTLKLMVDERLERLHGQNGVRVKSMTEVSKVVFEIYAAEATTSDDRLLGHAGADASKMFDEIHRTIGTDDRLAKSLIVELAGRNVHPGEKQPDGSKDHIALVSEWDTLYGRQLPEMIATAAGCTDKSCDWILNYSYLRGLDGETAGRSVIGKEAPGKNENKDAAGNGKGSDPQQDARRIERADGNSQLDYLRRLASSMRQHASQHRHDGSGEIKAIGIFGTDVFDKLLILQALRPQFPKAVFFTTDLDARLLHPAENGWTRNLIVASSYGLELNPGLQKSTPPFRDSYQTAIFLTTQLALSKSLVDANERKQKLAAWLETPRTFEIGRTRAFDLSPKDPAPSADCNDLARCKSIHPPTPDFFPEFGHGYALTITFVMASLFLVLLAYSWRLREAAISLLKPMPLLSLVVIVALCSYGISLVIEQGRGGEPLVWLEGISIWPTELLRLAAALLCIYFIPRALRELGGNRNALAKEFALASPAPPALRDLLRNWRALGSIYSWRRPDPGDKSIQAEQLWTDYQTRSILTARLCRVLPIAVLYIVFAGYLIGFDPPHVPTRGDASLHVNNGLMYITVALFVLLLFLSVDAIRLCERFIQNLRGGSTNWPDATIRKFSLQFGVTEPTERSKAASAGVLNDWIDIQFIACYTARIEKLIWYPFVIIALLVIARSKLFDNWDLPLSLLSVIAISVIYVVACAVILQRAAARARETAVEKMNAKLIHARGDPASAQLANQLAILTEEVRTIEKGAFLPLAQLPVVHAVAVMLSSFGGISVLEYVIGAVK